MVYWLNIDDGEQQLAVTTTRRASVFQGISIGKYYSAALIAETRLSRIKAGLVLQRALERNVARDKNRKSPLYIRKWPSIGAARGWRERRHNCMGANRLAVTCRIGRDNFVRLTGNVSCSCFAKIIWCHPRGHETRGCTPRVTKPSTINIPPSVDLFPMNFVARPVQRTCNIFQFI